MAELESRCDARSSPGTAPVTERWQEIFEAADRALDPEPGEQREFVERCSRLASALVIIPGENRTLPRVGGFQILRIQPSQR